MTETQAGLRVKLSGDRPRAVDVVTETYPGFPTDLQAQMMAMLCTADGTGLLEERSSKTASCTPRNWCAWAPISMCRAVSPRCVALTGCGCAGDGDRPARQRIVDPCGAGRRGRDPSSGGSIISIAAMSSCREETGRRRRRYRKGAGDMIDDARSKMQTSVRCGSRRSIPRICKSSRRLLQDAVFPVLRDALGRKAERRFAMLVNRFRWEDARRGRPRAGAGAARDRGREAVRSQGVDKADRTLSCRF